MKIVSRAISGFGQINIRWQILSGYVLLVLLVLASMLWGNNWLSRYLVLNYTSLAAGNNLGVVKNSLANSLRNAESSANMMLIGLNGLDFLKVAGEPLDIRQKNLVERQLNYGAAAFSDVKASLFCDQFGRIFSSDLLIANQFAQQDNRALLKTVKESSSKAFWLPMSSYQSFATGADGFAGPFLAKKVVDIDSGDYLGSLFVLLDEATMQYSFNELQFTPHSAYALMDSSGKILMATEDSGLSKDTFFPATSDKDNSVQIAGREYIQVEESFPELNIRLVYSVPVDELLPNKMVIGSFMLLIALGLFALSLLLAFTFSTLLTRPILRLCTKISLIRKAHGSEEHLPQAKNEISLLQQNFSSMMEEIDQLIEKVRWEQKEKRKHELALLQSQIQPHFLYNTLDTAYVLSHLGEKEAAKETIKALADFYRVALSSGQEEISLERELRNIQDYLKIQTIRYHDILTYEIEVDNRWLDNAILKLSIQPLVENAIYHGIKPLGKPGHIRIFAVSEEGDLYIYVEDNGVGFSQNHPDELLCQRDSKSFGLLNVHQRLKLHYGDKYGIILKAGAVTQVILHLPRQSILRREADA